MSFEFMELNIKGIYRIIPRVFKDGRGYFTEIYKRSEFKSIGINVDFNQDNQSYSAKGTLRGLHFQRPPYSQGKLVRVSEGKIFDVAVDLRINSPTFGNYVSAILSGDNMHMLWIPEGFAHGFLALENSLVNYKATSEYNKESEGGIIWNDSSINIKWPENPSELSEKDKLWPTLSNSKL